MPYRSGSLILYQNGQELAQGAENDWEETSPPSGTFTLEVAPQVVDILTATYVRSEVVTGTVIGGAAVGSSAADFTVWDPLAPPVAPSAYDDEFSDSSLDDKWTEFDPDAHLTVTEEASGLNLVHGAYSGDDVVGIYQTIPAGNFTIWTAVSLLAPAIDYVRMGLALWENPADTSKGIQQWRLGYNTASPYRDVCVERFNNYQSWNSTPFNLGAISPGGVYLRLRRNGTTYFFDVSEDGIGWMQCYSAALAFTPTKFGLGVNLNCATSGLRGLAQFFRYLDSDVGATGLVGGWRIKRWKDGGA